MQNIAPKCLVGEKNGFTIVYAIFACPMSRLWGENAIKKLQEIATFFRKTEPHSPMSYTIEQVIRWSELSLPELLNELITDSDARTGYFKLSGIKISETET